MDFITKLPSSYGHDTILTITDHDVSKASIFLPCKETIDTVSVAALYATHVFPHYGIPLRIISDRDPCFNSKFTTELCRLLGICQNISTVYHPQTNGQLEQTNQSLETYLHLYCDMQQHEWAKLLPMVLLLPEHTFKLLLWYMQWSRDLAAEMHHRHLVQNEAHSNVPSILSHDCTCDSEWWCEPHNACFIHNSCFCPSSGSFPLVKPLHTSLSPYSS